MQSTRSASTMRWRISPSPDWCEPSSRWPGRSRRCPSGARWWMKCWTQAKLALPAGGVPYRQRTSSRRSSPRQSRVVERRIGEDEVGLEVRVQVVVEGVGVARSEVGLDAADGEVHLRQAPGGGVGLLAVDADVADPPAVGLDEPLALDEHAAASRSRGRRRGPCTARASRPAGGRRSGACRTGRPACPRRSANWPRKYS